MKALALQYEIKKKQQSYGFELHIYGNYVDMCPY